MILAGGAGALAVVSAGNLNISTDSISTALACWNFGIVGSLTFYKPVASVLHRTFLVTLFGLMAVLAMIRPRLASHFTPFLLPTNFQIPNTTPRIFYEVNGLRLRATDFMFYGMMASVATESVVSIS